MRFLEILKKINAVLFALSYFSLLLGVAFVGVEKLAIPSFLLCVAFAIKMWW